MNILIGIIVCCIFVAPLLLLLLVHNSNKPTHNPNHDGIVDGGRDIICPKCKSSACQYAYKEVQVIPDQYRTKTKVHLFNIFKPLVEEKTRVIPGVTKMEKQYRCMNCGWIFK